MKEIKELELELNKEYEMVGTITIESMHMEVVDISEIIFVKAIMEISTPLNVHKPIILAHNYVGYELIDGYHRLNHSLQSGHKYIQCIVLDKYKIERKEDTLAEFLQGCVGKNITFLSNESMLVEGQLYYIEANEGCGGCDYGWSSVEISKNYIGKPIAVKSVNCEVIKEVYDFYDDWYQLYINNKQVGLVDTGWGNGFYGGDFGIHLVN